MLVTHTILDTKNEIKETAIDVNNVDEPLYNEWEKSDLLIVAKLNLLTMT